MNLRNEPGWSGAFTRDEHPGAIPNGTAIVKAVHEDGDATPIGTRGTVLGSMSFPDLMDGMPFYFVEWENRPKWAVGIIAWKIKVAP